MNWKGFLPQAVAACLILTALNTSIANSSTRETAYAPTSNNFGFFEIGISAKGFTSLHNSNESIHTETGLNLRAGYHWSNGFFIDIANFGEKGGGAGYTFYTTQNWDFSVLIHSAREEMKFVYPHSELRVGLRGTRYFDDSIFRFIISPLSLNSYNEGINANAWYGKSWHYRNWNFHGIGGVNYYSDDSMDSYYGASDFFSNQKLTIYNPGAGIVLDVEIGASYAITENWVFESSIGQTWFSSAISDSPFVDKSGQTYLKMSIFYVF